MTTFYINVCSYGSQQPLQIQCGIYSYIIDKTKNNKGVNLLLGNY